MDLCEYCLFASGNTVNTASYVRLVLMAHCIVNPWLGFKRATSFFSQCTDDRLLCFYLYSLCLLPDAFSSQRPRPAKHQDTFTLCIPFFEAATVDELCTKWSLGFMDSLSEMSPQPIQYDSLCCLDMWITERTSGRLSWRWSRGSSFSPRVLGQVDEATRTVCSEIITLSFYHYTACTILQSILYIHSIPEPPSTLCHISQLVPFCMFFYDVFYAI